VLFLDEPTTGLDPQTRARTWEVLRSLREEHGVTLFLTTHYMEEAENCDRIAVIDHGAVIELDTPEALKRRLGRDRVRLTTRAPAALDALLRSKYGLDPTSTVDGLEVSVEDGGHFVVRLIGEDRPDLDAISLRRPSLDDVFLALTGREIRAQQGEGAAAWRAAMRRRG
jgi:ABC-2 type transport system ATP-binding protein